MTLALTICAKLLAFEHKINLVDLIEHQTPCKIGPVIFIDSSDRWIRALAVPALNLNLYLTRMDDEVDLTIGLPVSEHTFFQSLNFHRKYDCIVSQTQLEDDLKDGLVYAQRIAEFWKGLQQQRKIEIDGMTFHRIDLPRQRGLRILYRNGDVAVRFDLLDEMISIDGPLGTAHVKFDILEMFSDALYRLKLSLRPYRASLS